MRPTIITLCLVLALACGCKTTAVKNIGEPSKTPLFEVHVGTDVKLFWPSVEFWGPTTDEAAKLEEPVEVTD